MEAGLVQILEGALLAAGEPLSVQRMILLFEEDERPAKEDIRAAIKSVEERCEDRGYELVQVASGYRFQVRQNLCGLGGSPMAGAPRAVFTCADGDAFTDRLSAAHHPRGDRGDSRCGG